ncbi:MAG: peptidoglycan DD-metalloendopeptidase family protein [Bacteroidales bacterium]|nr:peptidoglycan DD-metalloendopeptidase family protein [Bacteroidales bacterium]
MYSKADLQINKPLADSSISNQVSPIRGKVISPFGYRGRHKHTGVDIKLQKGDTVRAAFGGIVKMAAHYSGYGNLVILKHTDHIETYYAHLSKCIVKEGKTVAAGEVIGLGGRTGRATTNHLHFEIRFNRVPQNPEYFFNFNNCTVKIPVLAYAPTSKTENKTKSDTEVETETTETKTEAEQCSKSDVSNDFVIIQKGDTLYALARKHGTTVKHLQDINHLESPNLRIGMKLKIK